MGLRLTPFCFAGYKEKQTIRLSVNLLLPTPSPLSFIGLFDQYLGLGLFDISKFSVILLLCSIWHLVSVCVMPFISALHLKPPCRAEHVGSLLRPPALYEKRCQYEQGKCTKEELTLAEDEAIRGIVEFQRKAGLKTITDGEFRR